MQIGGRIAVVMHVDARVDAAIVALARRQHGVVTTAHLLDAGLGPHAIGARVRKGWLRRLHRGVYLVGALESELTRPAAALLATGPDAALSHRTAAVLWELLPSRPGDPVQVTLLNANRRSRRASRSIERTPSTRGRDTVSA